jgi:hypothetical protein
VRQVELSLFARRSAEVPVFSAESRVETEQTTCEAVRLFFASADETCPCSSSRHQDERTIDGLKQGSACPFETELHLRYRPNGADE